jgi:hypothetical protein
MTKTEKFMFFISLLIFFTGIFVAFWIGITYSETFDPFLLCLLVSGVTAISTLQLRYAIDWTAPIVKRLDKLLYLLKRLRG